MIGCRGEPSSFIPPTAGYLADSLSFPALSLGPGPGAERHTRSAHHGSYSRRVPRLSAEHRRHGGRAAPLPPGAQLGAHIPASAIRDPRCYGIASGGVQRRDLITSDRLPARGRLDPAAVCFVFVVALDHVLKPSHASVQRSNLHPTSTRSRQTELCAICFYNAIKWQLFVKLAACVS